MTTTSAHSNASFIKRSPGGEECGYCFHSEQFFIGEEERCIRGRSDRCTPSAFFTKLWNFIRYYILLFDLLIFPDIIRPIWSYLFGYFFFFFVYRFIDRNLTNMYMYTSVIDRFSITRIREWCLSMFARPTRPKKTRTDGFPRKFDVRSLRVEGGDNVHAAFIVNESNPKAGRKGL